MFSHVTLGTNDIEKAEKFYDAVMAVLGHPVLFKGGGVAAYGEPAGEKVFILPPFDKKEARPANGGTDEGAPGLRAYYHPNYYGAYVRDPDGNKIQAVCQRKQS